MPSSSPKIVNVLSSSLQLAVKDGRLPANAAHEVNLPKVGKPAKRYLSHDEVRDLADAVDSLDKAMYGGERNNYGMPVKVLADLKSHAGKQGGSPAFAEARTRWLRGRMFRRGCVDDAASVFGQDGLTPHELRRTAASLAISTGANVRAIQRMLGHALAAVTLDVYPNLVDRDLDAVSVALEVEIARTCSSPRVFRIADGTQSV